MFNHSIIPSGVPLKQCICYEAELRVHPDHVGFIIGNKGATINDVKTRTKVDEISIIDRYTNDARVYIRGKFYNVENAYEAIREIAHKVNLMTPRA